MQRAVVPLCRLVAMRSTFHRRVGPLGLRRGDERAA
jgi:hypothetical protein